MIVDCHCHLDYPSFLDDIDEVIARARSAGVKAIITNGINPETNRRCLDLGKRYDIIKVALGIYPIEQLKKEIEEFGVPLQPNVFNPDDEIDFIRKRKRDIIAIGEVGLDFSTKDDMDGQKELFQKMISLAQELGLPLIVHSRKAEKEAIEMLTLAGAKRVVMHCFMGKIKLLKSCIEQGWMFTIPANANRSPQFQRLAEELPLGNILTETDAPYLSPYPGKRNEPAFIAETIKVLSRIKGTTEEDMERQIFLNYQRMFL